MTWHVCFSYLTNDGETFDGDEFIYNVTSAKEAMEHFDGIADAFKAKYGWARVFVWGVKLMYKHGTDAVKEDAE